MNNPEPKVSKGFGFSRRRALKQAIFAGAGLALAGSTTYAIAETSTSSGVSLPQSSAPGANEVKPNSPPITGFNYNIYSGSEFLPPDDNNTKFVTQNQNIMILDAPDNTDVYFHLPLDLPQSARLTQIEFYLIHHDGQSAVMVGIYVPVTGTINYVNIVSVTTTSAQVQTIDLGNLSGLGKVDNTNFKYGLYWKTKYVVDSGPGADYLYGARVAYAGGTAHFSA